MQKRKIYTGILAALIVVTAGCSKKFLEEKRDLTGVNEEVFQDEQFAQAYVDYIYGLFGPADNAITMVQWQTGANGAYSDAYSRTTDELSGQTDYNREWTSISNNQNHANQYFGQRMTSSIANNTWTRMKQINIFLDEIDKHGLPEATRNRLKGQMYFWRAYQYFELLRLYGGVPLILHAQNPISVDGDLSKEVPRSKSSETVDQIVADLDMAMTMLPGKWPAGDYGKITSGAAAAMKGRVLLTWASPLFNRADDRTRWQKAYDANLAARNLLTTNGYKLYDAGGFTNGTAWENMFLAGVDNPEAVFVYPMNTVTADQTQRNNGWEQATRSKQILGGGSISPTKQIIESFPMKNGKPITDPTSGYNAKQPYKNRDPRFAKTFVWNGAIWPYSGAATFRQWTYSWYTNSTTSAPDRFTETQGPNSSAFYVRKATSPTASSSGGNFGFSGIDYIELRFAEVILNLAESAAGADKPTEAMDNLKLIRQRAGIDAANDYGLAPATGDRDKLLAACINERKIEFAYENKRFFDLRRWLLFNNDFGTCTRLEQTPIDGTRRTAYYIYVKLSAAGARYNGTPDPLLKRADGTTPTGIDREPAAFGPGVSNMDQHIDSLYNHHFVIIDRDNLDPTSPANWKFKWYNNYYFFGLHLNILTASPYLLQTKDWPDLNNAPGTFDPLQ